MRPRALVGTQKLLNEGEKRVAESAPRRAQIGEPWQDSQRHEMRFLPK